MHHTASERSTKHEDLEVSNSNILQQHKQTPYTNNNKKEGRGLNPLSVW